MQDPRSDLKNHTLVVVGGKLFRTSGQRILKPVGKPGFNRIFYDLEPALIPRDGVPRWGIYFLKRDVRASRLTLVEPGKEVFDWRMSATDAP